MSLQIIKIDVYFVTYCSVFSRCSKKKKKFKKLFDTINAMSSFINFGLFMQMFGNNMKYLGTYFPFCFVSCIIVYQLSNMNSIVRNNEYVLEIIIHLCYIVTNLDLSCLLSEKK